MFTRARMFKLKQIIMLFLGWLANLLTASSAAAVSAVISLVSIQLPSADMHIPRYSQFAVIWYGDAAHKHSIRFAALRAQMITNFPVTTVAAGVSAHIFPAHFLTRPGVYTISIVPEGGDEQYDISTIAKVSFVMDH